MARRLVPRRVRRHHGRAAPRPRVGRRAGYPRPGQPQDDRAVRGGAGRGARASRGAAGRIHRVGLRPSVREAGLNLDHHHAHRIPAPGDRPARRVDGLPRPDGGLGRRRPPAGRRGGYRVAGVAVEGPSFAPDGPAQGAGGRAPPRRARLAPDRGLLPHAGRDAPADDPLQGPGGPVHLRQRAVLRRAGDLPRSDQGEDRLRLLPPRAGREVSRRRPQGPREPPGGRRRRAARHAQGGDALRPDDEDAAFRARRRAHRHPGHLLGRDRADARRGAAQGAEHHAPATGALRAPGARGAQGRAEPDGLDREARQPGSARRRRGP